jgi:hypothetical protein
MNVEILPTIPFDGSVSPLPFADPSLKELLTIVAFVLFVAAFIAALVAGALYYRSYRRSSRCRDCSSVRLLRTRRIDCCSLPGPWYGRLWCGSRADRFPRPLPSPARGDSAGGWGHAIRVCHSQQEHRDRVSLGDELPGGVDRLDRYVVTGVGFECHVGIRVGLNDVGRCGSPSFPRLAISGSDQSAVFACGNRGSGKLRHRVKYATVRFRIVGPSTPVGRTPWPGIARCKEMSALSGHHDSARRSERMWSKAGNPSGRRHALIAAQLIELISKVTDATITMFCRLIARLFTKSKARQDQRHLDARKETGRLLRMFGDTLRVLAEANETGEDIVKELDHEIGWDRLVLARADVEALATTAEADPLLGAAERYSWVRRYAPALLDAFTFRSARTQDPLLTAIDLLRQLNRDDRRGLPAKVPLSHLTQKVRKLIAANGKRDRRL